MNGESRAVVHLPGAARELDMGPFRMAVLADATDTEAALTVLEAHEPPGFGPPMHLHHDAGEAFYVLEGLYVVFVEDDEHPCPAGSFVYVPAGMRHGFRVGPEPSRKLNIYVPGSMVGYFEALAASTASGEQLDAEALTDLAARHAMEVLGPVPEGYV